MKKLFLFIISVQFFIPNLKSQIVNSCSTPYDSLWTFSVNNSTYQSCANPRSLIGQTIYYKPGQNTKSELDFLIIRNKKNVIKKKIRLLSYDPDYNYSRVVGKYFFIKDYVYDTDFGWYYNVLDSESGDEYYFYNCRDNEFSFLIVGYKDKLKQKYIGKQYIAREKETFLDYLISRNNIKKDANTSIRKIDGGKIEIPDTTCLSIIDVILQPASQSTLRYTEELFGPDLLHFVLKDYSNHKYVIRVEAIVNNEWITKQEYDKEIWEQKQAYDREIRKQDSIINERKKKIESIQNLLETKFPHNIVPNNFKGVDIENLYQSLKKRQVLLEKSEFETKTQFENRIRLENSKPIIDNLTVDSIFFIQSFKVSNYNFKYEIDSLLLKFRLFNDFTTDSYNVICDKYIDKYYMGTNLYGLSAKIHYWEEDNYNLLFTNENLANKEDFRIFVDPEMAKSIKDGQNFSTDENKIIACIFIGEIKEPFTEEKTYESNGPTISDPFHYTEYTNMIRFELKCILVYNKQTGEIYDKIFYIP